MKYPLDIGCTKAWHQKIGIDAVINARGNQQWRNQMTMDNIELMRDGQRIRDKLDRRIRMYQVCSRFFRKHQGRIEHLFDNYDD